MVLLTIQNTPRKSSDSSPTHLAQVSDSKQHLPLLIQPVQRFSSQHNTFREKGHCPWTFKDTKVLLYLQTLKCSSQSKQLFSNYPCLVESWTCFLLTDLHEVLPKHFFITYFLCLKRETDVATNLCSFSFSVFFRSSVSLNIERWLFWATAGVTHWLRAPTKTQINYHEEEKDGYRPNPFLSTVFSN